MTNALGSRKCPDCKGTGNVGGLAGRLFAAHPITRVVLTDREPVLQDNEHSCCWFDERTANLPGFDDRPDSNLPAELMALLPVDDKTGGIRSECGLCVTYPTRNAALAAKSAACVAYGRSKVNWIAEYDREKGLVKA